MPTAPTASQTHESKSLKLEYDPQQRVGPKVSNWDSLITGAGASLLQSHLWGEFKRASGWTPLRLALSRDALHEQRCIPNDSTTPNSKLAIAAQLLFRSVPKLPLPISVAYIPRGPIYFSP